MLVSKLPDLKQYRLYLIPLILVILMLVSGIMILKPKTEEIFALRRDLSRQKAELAQLTQKLAILEGYDQEELKYRAERMLRVLPAEKNGPLVLAMVRSLAGDHNLELVSMTIEIGEISTESAQTKEPLPSLEIGASVTGSLDDLANFLNALESSAPIMRLRGLSISREGETIDSNIVLSTYYLNVPKDIGKPSRRINLITQEEEKVYQELSRYQLPAVGTELPRVSSGKENPFAL